MIVVFCDCSYSFIAIFHILFKFFRLKELQDEKGGTMEALVGTTLHLFQLQYYHLYSKGCLWLD